MMLLMMMQEEFAAAAAVSDDLIVSIAAGDREAFHRLYETASRSIYGFALSITRNPHDAEDVLQDTMLTVHRKAGEYIPRGKPMAWILTIAKNLARMKLRSHLREADAPDWAETADPISHIDDLESRMTLQALLALLPEEERQIVMLRSVAGLKAREVASLLGCPLGTVLSKHNRAMKKLKEKLEEEGLA